MFDKRLMALCPESRRYILGNILLQWLELCCNTIMIGAIASAVNSLYQGALTGGQAAAMLLAIAVSILLRFFTAKEANRMSYMASKSVKKKMRELIYQKLLKLGMGYREKVSTAELVQESVEGVDQLESYFGQYVPQFFYAFLAPITLFFLFGFGGSWATAAALLICVPLIPGAIMMVQKIAKKLLAKYWGQYTQLGSTFLENLQGMTTLKAYQADGFKNEQMNQESEHFRVVTMKVLTMQLNSIIIMDLFAYGGAGLGILLATKAFAGGNLGLANCVFMILLSADFFLPMRRLGSYFHVAMNGMAASDKIFKFLALDEPPQKDGALPENGGEIRLQQVSFSYEPEREVLHGVSLAAPQGSMIGIVGESGSGKSTIASLLLGRNTPSSGAVTIAGRPIGEISEESLMRAVTYVGHNSAFFKGTVRDNLLLGRPDADDGALWQALEKCQLAAFLQTQQGLDTPLTENAANLSGGQRQRLAFARALLHDSPIYIFDEATSNIDVESEETILRQIHALARTKTVLLISHRLMNTASASRVYVLEEGRLAEEGRHEELLAKNGVYARLWRTQQALEQLGREAV